MACQQEMKHPPTRAAPAPRNAFRGCFRVASTASSQEGLHDNAWISGQPSLRGRRDDLQACERPRYRHSQLMAFKRPTVVPAEGLLTEVVLKHTRVVPNSPPMTPGRHGGCSRTTAQAVPIVSAIATRPVHANDRDGSRDRSGRPRRDGVNAADNRLGLAHRLGAEIFAIRHRTGRRQFLDGLADRLQCRP
jgi:hypothetical protein